MAPAEARSEWRYIQATLTRRPDAGKSLSPQLAVTVVALIPVAVVVSCVAEGTTVMEAMIIRYQGAQRKQDTRRHSTEPPCALRRARVGKPRRPSDCRRVRLTQVSTLPQKFNCYGLKCLAASDLGWPC